MPFLFALPYSKSQAKTVREVMRTAPSAKYATLLSVLNARPEIVQEDWLLYWKVHLNGTVYTTASSHNAIRQGGNIKACYISSFMAVEATTPLTQRQYATVHVFAWNGSESQQPWWGGIKWSCTNRCGRSTGGRPWLGDACLLSPTADVVWRPMGALFRQCVAMDASFNHPPFFRAIATDDADGKVVVVERLGI